MSLVAKSAKAKFYRKAILATTLVVASIVAITSSLRLTYDLQPNASITGKHNYLLNLWNTSPQATGLTPYRELYQHLTAENQQLVRSYSRQLALTSQALQQQRLLQLLSSNWQKILARLEPAQQQQLKQLLANEQESLNDIKYVALKAQLLALKPGELGLEKIPSAESFPSLSYPLAYYNFYLGEIATNQFYRGWQGIEVNSKDSFLQNNKLFAIDNVDLDAVGSQAESEIFNHYPKLGITFRKREQSLANSLESASTANSENSISYTPQSFAYSKEFGQQLEGEFAKRLVFSNVRLQFPYLTPSYRVLYQKLADSNEVLVGLSATTADSRTAEQSSLLSWQPVVANLPEQFQPYLAGELLNALDLTAKQEVVAKANFRAEVASESAQFAQQIASSKESVSSKTDSSRVDRLDLAGINQQDQMAPSQTTLGQAERNKVIEAVSNEAEPNAEANSAADLASVDRKRLAGFSQFNRDFSGFPQLEKYFYANGFGKDLRKQADLSNLSPNFAQGSLSLAYCGKRIGLDFTKKSAQDCVDQAWLQAKAELAQLLAREAEAYVILPYQFPNNVLDYEFAYVKYANNELKQEFISLLPETTLGQQLAYQLYALENNGLIPQLPATQKLIKYVVGLPGDTIEIYPDGLYLNGIYLRNVPAGLASKLTPAGRKLVLAKDEYWLMGDNPQSIDSLYFGPVAKQQLIGKAIVAW